MPFWSWLRFWSWYWQIAVMWWSHYSHRHITVVAEWKCNTRNFKTFPMWLFCCKLATFWIHESKSIYTDTHGSCMSHLAIRIVNVLSKYMCNIWNMNISSLGMNSPRLWLMSSQLKWHPYALWCITCRIWNLEGTSSPCYGNSCGHPTAFSARSPRLGCSSSTDLPDI